MEVQKINPICLLILDGWGIGKKYKGNAIELADTPNIDKYWKSMPHTLLSASGESVGLPQGEDGNTETGHLNIGAGQIVYQDLPRINLSIADGSFYMNATFKEAMKHTQSHQSKLHIMGLIGGGGVHSNYEHFIALLNLYRSMEISNDIIVHAFTDGRDSPPNSGIDAIVDLQNQMDKIGLGKIGTIIGRYYAMDRDQRWDRTEIAYNALTLGEGVRSNNPVTAIQESYSRNETDEFIKPIIITDESGHPHGLINDNDSVIFFNFRIDRPRQLTKAFVLNNFENHNAGSQNTNQRIAPFIRQRKIKNLYFSTMTEYEKGLPAHIAFPPEIVEKPFSSVVSDAGIAQVKIAETEKERFVTYYFNGQREAAFPNEDWHIVPSKKVATYDLAPEMSSREIAETVIQDAKSQKYGVIIVNFAAADMVAHTGKLEAGVQACSIVDECVGRIVDTIWELGGAVLITADHGNAEEMISMKDGSVDTEHSTFPVPFIIISPHLSNHPINLPQGILADVSPTMLTIMNLPKPPQMLGNSLIDPQYIE